MVSGADGAEHLDGAVAFSERRALGTRSSCFSESQAAEHTEQLLGRSTWSSSPEAHGADAPGQMEQSQWSGANGAAAFSELIQQLS